MHFNVATLGNHEFDEGLGEFNRIVTGGAPVQGVTNHYDLVKDYSYSGLGTNILCANVVDKTTGQLPYGFKPYEIKEVKNKTTGATAKIGFIGVLTTDMPNLTTENNYGPYNYLDEAETIAKYEKELRAQGVNAIVVVGHTGAAQGTNSTVTGQTKNILDKLNSIDKDNSVDFYICGHTHEYVNAKFTNPNNGEAVRVVQSLNQTKAFENILTYINPATQDFETGSTSVNVYPVLNKAQDASLTDKTTGKYVSSIANTVEGIVKDAETRVEPIVSQELVKTSDGKLIAKAQNGMGESPCGDVVVDAQLARARAIGLTQEKPFNVDFSMTNIGGVRLDLQTDANGFVTYGSVCAVQPFGNLLDVVEMTGAQIRAALNNNYGSRVLQIAGLRYTIDTEAYKTATQIGGLDENGKQVTAVKDIYAENGTKVQDNKVYHVVINDFLWGAGDGYSAFKGCKLIGNVGVDTDEFANYFTGLQAAGKTLQTPVLNRIVDASSDEAAKLAHDAKIADAKQNLADKTEIFNTESAKLEAIKKTAPKDEVKAQREVVKQAKQELHQAQVALNKLLGQE
jgi:5'-nucleotidase